METRRSILPMSRWLVAPLVLWALWSCGREGYQETDNPCDGIACSSHGTCVPLPEGPQCFCEVGYYADGLACLEENVVNPCAGITCSGFGTCAVRNAEPVCVCAPGYHNPPDNQANCVADVHPCDGEDGSPCDDGEFCTVDDTCQAGICTGDPHPCDDDNSCTVDICNEIDDQCTNTPAADNTPCDDGSYCTIGERCQDATCVGGTARVCSDGNPCTADSCDDDLAACVNAPMADDSPCEDGAFCTEADTCQAGVCQGGSPRDCQDGNDCTSNLCNESLDACENPPVVDGTPCEDGQYCSIGDLCAGGACQGGSARDCSDGDQCTADACDDDLDLCVYASVPDGTTCTDGLFCTLNEACTDGMCGNGMARDCSDGNPCTQDLCNDLDDTCDHPHEQDGMGCDDGQFCTETTSCNNGICGGGTPHDCSDGNDCTLDSCDEQANDCVSNASAMNGVGCDDGQFCTVSDTCADGACAGSTNPCDDGNPCTVDTCDEQNGCVNTPALDGTGCDDGLFCTTGDVCNTGVCEGQALDCDDTNPCTADACNEVGDTCVNNPVTNGTACEDGLYCTVGEVCNAGSCAGGFTRNCSDGNQCTTDVCDEDANACTNPDLANGTPCDDGAFCTENEFCTGGACGGGSAMNCADTNPCTADVCDENNDTCDHPAVVDGIPCQDGQFCTDNDSCLGGVCTGGLAHNCSDGNPCTNDVCDDVGNTCVSTAVVDGTTCDDGEFCTLGETCTGGTCGAGSARNCNDGNACTTDSCDDAANTCVNTAVSDGAPCDDGAFCTDGETCSGGVCGGSVPLNCNDSNPCTQDFCDESSDACVNDGAAFNGNVCDDGLFCTIDDACLNGSCEGGGANNCSDGDPCTLDSCDEVGDACVNDAAAANGTACNDGSFCTVSDVCTNGTCGGASRDCSDGNVCTLDSCDEVGDQCINNAPGANGLNCDDGLFCLDNSTCTNGVCGGGTAHSCNDFDPCTVDSCDEGNDQCVNNAPAANGFACDDGQYCNVGETCLNGACQGGAANGCSDGNPCTLDSCDEGTDQCVNDAAAANGSACDDGAYCTENETCTGGICGGGSARNCADADPCSVDSCDEVNNTCDHTPALDGTACNDGQYCNVGEICTGGVCGGGMARTCNDGNQCTADVCDEGNDACTNDDEPDGTACDDGIYCLTGETCLAGLCGGGSPLDCEDGEDCTLDSCNEGAQDCDHDTAVFDGVPCDDGNYCLIGEVCAAGACGGASVRLCDDGNPCTANNCNEGAESCENPDLANGTPCEAGQFCTSGDTCQSGSCQEGAIDPCSNDPCANLCDEINDVCSGCAPAGSQCFNAVQEATCDGACNTSQLIICEYGCNLSRNECNECGPSTVECKGDVEYLCNAEFVCDADGLLLSKTCCGSGRCSCDGALCLEDLCDASPDLSGGGNINSSDICTNDDNIPGDCNPGGAACRDSGSGGAPEQFFQFTLNDSTGNSAFYTVQLDSIGSAFDTSLRASTLCGSEVEQFPFAEVCLGTPGTSPQEACVDEAGPDQVSLCGLPEGAYYGALDSPGGICGAWDLDVTITQVDLDTGPQAGNISMGGTFIGNTCSLNDDYQFPETTLWAGAACADCVAEGTDARCPDCGVGAAIDCTLGNGSTDDKCTYDGGGSPDAVFYLALQQDSGVDISTAGSDFDTVIYIMQTGPTGASPPGILRICNDDCWTTDGPSHIQTTLKAGLYYVYLDGANSDCGNYKMRVVVSPASRCGNLSCEDPYENCVNCPLDCKCPNCGDGVIDSGEGEQCDDFNTTPDDCCSDLCYIEEGCSCVGEPSSCGTLFYLDETSNCACAIPDCYVNPGITCDTSNYGTQTDTITIGSACTIADVTVDMDISHTYRGDVSIELTSPLGTSIRLKGQDGGDGTDDIVGTFDITLAVDGPGSLDDFFGEDGSGDWTLTLHDWWEGDSGTLNNWSLHLTCQ